MAVAHPVAGVPIDLASVWARIELIEDPGDPEPLPEDEDWVQPSPASCPGVGSLVGGSRKLLWVEDLSAHSSSMSRLPQGLSFSWGIIAAGIATSRPKRVTQEQAQAWDAYKQAFMSWQLLVNDWAATACNDDFANLKQHLKEIKGALEDLPQERQKAFGIGWGAVIKGAVGSIPGRVSHRRCQAAQHRSGKIC